MRSRSRSTISSSKRSRSRSRSRKNAKKTSKKSSKKKRVNSRKNQLKESVMNAKTKKDMHWKDLAPMSTRERNALKASCFLREEERTYPVCPKRVDGRTCKGVKAARARAVLNRDETVVHTADHLSDVMMCGSKAAAKRDIKTIAKSIRRSMKGNRTRRKSRSKREAKREKAKAAKDDIIEHTPKSYLQSAPFHPKGGKNQAQQTLNAALDDV